MLEANKIICGDALATLKALPDGCIDMCCTSPPYHSLRRYLPDDHPDKHLEIGTEPSYDEYVMRLCDVFDEVKRVLKPQGSLWVNMADNFSCDGGGRPSLYLNKAKRYNFVLPKRPQSDIPKKSLCPRHAQRGGLTDGTDVRCFRVAGVRGKTSPPLFFRESAKFAV